MAKSTPKPAPKKSAAKPAAKPAVKPSRRPPQSLHPCPLRRLRQQPSLRQRRSSNHRPQPARTKAPGSARQARSHQLGRQAAARRIRAVLQRQVLHRQENALPAQGRLTLRAELLRLQHLERSPQHRPLPRRSLSSSLARRLRETAQNHYRPITRRASHRSLQPQPVRGGRTVQDVRQRKAIEGSRRATLRYVAASPSANSTFAAFHVGSSTL